MLPLKPDRFKQLGPKDQMYATMMALEGHISNCADGVISPAQLEERIKPYLDDLRCLRGWMPQGWVSTAPLGATGWCGAKHKQGD